MPNDTNNSLVNFGNLAKPADTLIKKVSKAVGGIFAPIQITRIAKAEAKAAIIKAEADIQITDLHRRAMHRFVEEEAQKQQNIEDITSQAIPYLTEQTDADKMDDDWVTNFFDKSRIVSDKEMQGLWARVLAEEANKPGTFSKRTVNFLGDLDKVDAELFASLCGYCWDIGEQDPLILDIENEIYNKAGINFESLSHLDSIGLINFDHSSGFRRIKLPKRFSIFYFGNALALELPKEADNEIPLGKVIFTKIGKELMPICGSKPVEGFMEYVKEKWKTHIPKPDTKQDAPENP